MTIEFEDGCRIDKEHDAVIFWVRVDGKPMRCLISYEAMLGFGPGSDADRFYRYRERVLETARRMVRRGLVTEGEVRILSTTPLADVPATTGVRSPQTTHRERHNHGCPDREETP